MPLMNFFNPLMIWLLHSPLHMLAGRSTMLITFTGRRNGKSHTTPVNYIIDDGTLLVITLRNRSWWKNLRGGAKVKVRLRGKDVDAEGMAVEDEAGVAAHLNKMVEKAPGYAKYLKIRRDAQGRFIYEDIVRAAKGRVGVRVTLLAAI